MKRLVSSVLVAGLLLAFVATAIAASSQPRKEGSSTRLTVSPKSLNFKNGTLELSFSVSASGGSIAGSVAAPAAPFSISAGAGSFSLSAGDTRNVEVRFSPLAKGTYKSEIAVTSNANRNPNQSVSLTGSARTSVPTPSPTATPTPTRTFTARQPKR